MDKLISNGELEFREDSFWTTDLDYWNLDTKETKFHGSVLHKDLLSSNLVIFKGDLNYRKLTGDRKWPRTTKWETAIGPLATNGITTLSLRTCKADVQVGLPEGLDAKLSQEWEKENPGRGSWWCCSGKWASFVSVLVNQTKTNATTQIDTTFIYKFKTVFRFTYSVLFITLLLMKKRKSLKSVKDPIQ